MAGLKKEIPAAYDQVIEWVFFRTRPDETYDFAFSRDDLERAHNELGVPRPKNLGDVVYTYRFRKALPDSIRSLLPANLHWIIRLAGRGLYRFVAVPASDFQPAANRSLVKIPDATPGLVAQNTFTDEQALLAVVRYNRLIDTFLGITCYSLQNHLRTQVRGLGQIEVDEVYVGVDRNGEQYVVPVQAKGGNDRLGVVQIEQDFAFCEARFKNLKCRPVGAQFLRSNVVVLMLFAKQDGEIVVESERHYLLVPKATPAPA